MDMHFLGQYKLQKKHESRRVVLNHIENDEFHQNGENSRNFVNSIIFGEFH